MVRELENTGQLTSPADYLPENALRSAYLTLQDSSALTTCSTASIANALLSMVVPVLS